MVSLEYTKTDFEEDLRRLGKVPHANPADLPEVMGQEDAPSHAVVKGVIPDGIGIIGTINDEFPYSVRCRVEELAPSYESTAQGLLVRLGGQAISLYNPYQFSAYFPHGNNGNGEALLYRIEDERITQNVPEHTRELSEEEVIQRLRQDAYSVHDQSGLFIPRLELERLYIETVLKYARGRSSIKPFDEFAKEHMPSASISINPYHHTGELRLEDAISHGGTVINGIEFVGTINIECAGEVYRYNKQTHTLESVKLERGAEATFTPEHPLKLNRVLANRKAYNVNDFISVMLPAPQDKQEQPMPRRLTGRITLAQLIDNQHINEADLIGTPVSATRMLEKILATEPKDAYLKDLHKELRPDPSASVADIIISLRQAAQEQWIEVFNASKTLEPRVTGLGAVAITARIFTRRQRRNR